MEHGTGLPPRLPSAPPRRKPRLSPFRVVLRVLVWSVFGVVLGGRLIMLQAERRQAGWMGGGRFDGQFQGPFDGQGGGRRMRRGPARLPASPQAGATALPTNLWRLEIVVAPADVRKLQGYFWNGWGGGESGPRPEVPVTVREGGVTYTNVAMHPKGSAGSFRPFDDKPALTLNFSKNAKGQKFHGYAKVSLNNSVQDDSYLCEALSREIFVEAGVPAPRAEHATVVLNGRDLGLYVVAEGWGKPFLRRFFQDPGGNLYEGGFLKDIEDGPELSSGDNEADRSDLERLERAVSVTDPAARWEALGQVLDTDRFISFMALEVMTCHWDGYCLNRNNYRFFQDRASGRFVFMPHGLDQMFGVTRSSPHAPLYPSMRGTVARAVMGTPEGRRLYHERVASLRTNVFVEARLTNRVHEMARRIRPTLEAYSPDWAAAHDREVAFLCDRIGERVRSIDEQLASPPKPTGFSADGIAKVSGWAPRTAEGGTVEFERGERDGVRILRARIVRGGSGSWRARAELPFGQYRFEGRARTVGMGQGGGVTLRISGQRRGWARTPDGEWTALSFPIEVDEGVAEVELVCEFGGATGEAWFDEGSLQVVKVRE